MVTEQLINPKSIVVIGGFKKKYNPDGKVLFNLKEEYFKGELYIVYPKEN